MLLGDRVIPPRPPSDRVIDVAVPPEDLPAVAPRDLVAAWNAATVGAEIGLAVDPEDARGVRFHRPDGTETRVLFADTDAHCWVGALDRAVGLDSLHGIALCFRLLGLIHLMATAPWMRAWFEVGGGDGPEIHPALWRVAATLPLNAEARFDEATFRRHAEPLVGPRRLGR